MSEEIVDLSSVPVRGRKGRKAKYSHKIWEDTSPKGKAKYMLTLSDNWERRKNNGEVGTGRIVWDKLTNHVSYVDDENPYIRFVDKRSEYEIRMETVFHSDIENIEIDVEEDDDFFSDGDEMIVCSENQDVFDCDEVINDDELVALNTIVGVKMINDFYVVTEFAYDEITNSVFARVPAGVVTKKMSLYDILMKYEEYGKEVTWEKMKTKHPLTVGVLAEWLANAWSFHYKYNEE
jgi:hypothetical protein